MAQDKPKKNPWKNLFSKQDASEEALNYENLSFFKKSKNAMITFFLVISLLSAGITFFVNIEQLAFEDVLIDVVIYFLLMPFIYFNHRWAMLLTCLLYGVGKLFLMAEGLGSPVTHLLFLMIAISLTYKSVLVATYLKKQRAVTVMS